MTPPHVHVSRVDGVMALMIDCENGHHGAAAAVFRKIREHLDSVGNARAIVFGAVGTSLCVEVDVDTDFAIRAGGGDRDKSIDDYGNAIMRILEVDIPTISAVRGNVLGIGATLAFSTDICLATADSYFQFPGIAADIVANAGASWLLSHRLGNTRAKEMLMLGQGIDATTAKAWGLVERIVDEAELEQAAFAVAHQFNGTGCDPFTSWRQTLGLAPTLFGTGKASKRH